MRENRTSGSVQGAPGNRRSYCRRLIDRYHYLGYQPMAGAQLRYLIR